MKSLLMKYAEYMDMDKLILSFPDSIPLTILSDYFLSSLTGITRYTKKMNWQKECMEHNIRLGHKFSTLVHIPTEMICINCGRNLHYQKDDPESDTFVILWRKPHILFKHDPICSTK
jgi:hypothetical protein